MITPKEKAKELILQFSDIGLIVSGEAKQCSLVFVNEMLNVSFSNKMIEYNYAPNSSNVVTQQNYWKQVKVEVMTF
jgi:hypothetical protein